MSTNADNLTLKAWQGTYMKNKNIIEIEAITINIGDTTVKVTPQQAQMLFDALANLLGKPQQVTYVPYQQPHWWWNGGTWTTNSADTGTVTTSCYANSTSTGDARIIDIQ